MKITTKAVFDMSSGALLAWEGYEYDGPLDLAKPGKTQEQNNADTQSATDASRAGSLLDQSQKLSGTAQGTLGQFEGPVQDSPFYKALLTQGLEKTSGAYDNARSNMRQRANLSGFGYNQPVEQGGENQLQAQEAGALAQVPGEAMLQATGPALQAAGETGALSNAAGGQALGWGGQSLGWESNVGLPLEQQRQRQAGQNWQTGANALAGALLGI